MNTFSKALCWAGSLILLALGNAAGLVDDAAASTLFVVTWPIMLLTALAIKLENGVSAPVFYSQTRIGYTVKMDMPMLKGPVVQELYRRGARWLAGGALER